MLQCIHLFQCVQRESLLQQGMLSLLPADSRPLRVGGWSMSGLDRDDVASSSSEVTCFSSHLTSFAILVDASGVTGVRCAVQRRCSASLCIDCTFNFFGVHKYCILYIGVHKYCILYIGVHKYCILYVCVYIHPLICRAYHQRRHWRLTLCPTLAVLSLLSA